MKVAADVFPALIAIAPPGSLEDKSTFTPRGQAPDGTRRLDRCRVVVFNDKIVIGVDSPEGPQLVFREEVVSYSKEDTLHYAETVSGKILVFKKDNNCGCGSRLRSWMPYGDIMMATNE